MSYPEEVCAHAYDKYSGFVYPLFLHEESVVEPIPSMPGISRHSMASLLNEVKQCVRFVHFYFHSIAVASHIPTLSSISASLCSRSFL